MSAPAPELVPVSARACISKLLDIALPPEFLVPIHTSEFAQKSSPSSPTSLLIPSSLPQPPESPTSPLVPDSSAPPEHPPVPTSPEPILAHRPWPSEWLPLLLCPVSRRFTWLFLPDLT